MRDKRVLFLLVVLLVLVISVALVLRERLPVWRWTTLHSEELSAAIVRFEAVTTSWEAFQNQDQTSFAEVAAGTALRSRQLDVEFAPDIGSYFSQTGVQLDRVKVVSYTISLVYVEAIVHREGVKYYLETGEMRDIGIISWTLYLLTWEDETWKVANFASCPVPGRGWKSDDCELPSRLDY